MRPTVELMRRREFNQASPDESGCETRSRRSRPTICYVATYSSPRVAKPMIAPKTPRTIVNITPDREFWKGLT